MKTKIIQKIKNICKTFYYINPEKLEDKIRKVLDDYPFEYKNILVTGETNNLTVYIFCKNYVVVIMPFQKLINNSILREMDIRGITLNRHFAILPINDNLKSRLSLPKVVLINPYIVEKYPIPRLSLSVSIIASYLRKYQKARVWVLDTQLGINVKDIVKEVLRINPDIIGVSIPHGQTPLAIKILDNLYKLKNKGLWNGLIVIGNFIAASFPNYFLKKYRDIIVARGEGEKTMIDLIDYILGRKKLEEVSGIITSIKGSILSTPVKPVNMDDLPPPAFDTVEKLAELKGALTHEWNRGCFWQCTFCPREHKSKLFRGMSSDTILSQLNYFKDLMDRFPSLSRHLYIADEETIGGVSDYETSRLINIAKGMIKRKMRISFDVYSRIDQIYNPKMSEEWHIKRMKMWYYLKKAGLKRVFVGVESGSKTQLVRYGKGITPEQSVIAIRLLSSIGIDFRLGFIMFDPLMTLDEVIENIYFLERDDVLMKSLDNLKYSYNKFKKLFRLVHDEGYIKESKLGEPLCTRVSYMLAQLEVLAGCNYIRILKSAEKKYDKKLIIGHPDLKIGKINVKYLDPTIGMLANFSQKWIDTNFELMYAIKGIRKVANPNEKNILFSLMKTHRKLSLDYLKSMIIILVNNKFKLWELPLILKKIILLAKLTI